MIFKKKKSSSKASPATSQFMQSQRFPVNEVLESAMALDFGLDSPESQSEHETHLPDAEAVTFDTVLSDAEPINILTEPVIEMEITHEPEAFEGASEMSQEAPQETPMAMPELAETIDAALLPHHTLEVETPLPSMAGFKMPSKLMPANTGLEGMVRKLMRRSKKASEPVGLFEDMPVAAQEEDVFESASHVEAEATHHSDPEPIFEPEWTPAEPTIELSDPMVIEMLHDPALEMMPTESKAELEPEAELEPAAPERVMADEPELSTESVTKSNVVPIHRATPAPLPKRTVTLGLMSSNQSPDSVGRIVSVKPVSKPSQSSQYAASVNASQRPLKEDVLPEPVLEPMPLVEPIAAQPEMPTFETPPISEVVTDSEEAALAMELEMPFEMPSFEKSTVLPPASLFSEDTIAQLSPEIIHESATTPPQLIDHSEDILNLFLESPTESPFDLSEFTSSAQYEAPIQPVESEASHQPVSEDTFTFSEGESDWLDLDFSFDLPPEIPLDPVLIDTAAAEPIEQAPLTEESIVAEEIASMSLAFESEPETPLTSDTEIFGFESFDFSVGMTMEHASPWVQHDPKLIAEETGVWNANAVETLGEGSEMEIVILISIDLADHLKIMLVQHEAIFALMMDNGENAIVLRSFDTNPLALNPRFSVTQEMVLEDKAVYIARVGDWQGILSIHDNEVSLQAEI